MIILKKKNVLIITKIALLIIGIYIVSISGILNPFIEKITNETPEAKISAYIQAINKSDKKIALKIWEYPTWNLESNDYILLKERREKITDELIKEKITSSFIITNIEWWGTCCIPGVINNPSGAGGARAKVELMDINNKKYIYIFDIFVRETHYGGATEEPKLRHWVIRDIYPLGEEPLFWKAKK